MIYNAKGLPILPERILDNVREEVWRIRSDRYNFIKRPRSRGYSFSFASYKEAFKHAKFYRSLIKEGLYPPHTRVAICHDRENNPTILVLMKALSTNVSYEELEKNRARFYKIFRKHSLDKILDGDINYPFNYGKDENGVIYYHDLHLVQNKNTFKLPKNYKLPK